MCPNALIYDKAMQETETEQVLLFEVTNSQ